ncbi:TIGR04423 family type III CRISPR-associated protein [Campylobacter ureolyticus]|uniref:TIGR04423 family type III CRISPR-associated protein n=1 Tax=Campylobacter ureolyticus TaxID=827 RepID=A0A9Q4KRD0_9BACT|nr:TIGR04423 family type III CRISPR-associated protein [Campylobacter ureolyticus]MCZ6135444.1 TIGR04423 family type III CRISPR-associated protein [Campylobacter ureolyticus]MCZ6162336.1 TIGR04423 family type III CRISPR-associated protein [Campylobacter ureolyticus]MCZ6171325.1 TIGR04423 family type III CRISPR-associated protein [Campylobacter ureolyticus]
MILKSKKEVIEYINSNLQNYDGFVQFSNRKFDTSKDLFIDRSLKISDESGFISEGYFYNEATKTSVCIKMLDGKWLVCETNLDAVLDDDIEIYASNISDSSLYVKMAQIYKFEGGFAKDMQGNILDEFSSPILDRVVFAGFTKEIKRS